jgi:hypothetical protein
MQRTCQPIPLESPVMKMTKYLLAAFVLLGALARLHADDSMPSYAITLDGGYGDPFDSQGYSGRAASGLDGSVAFEYQNWDCLSLGVMYSQLGIQQDSISMSLGSLDVFARCMPFGRGSVEPYVLLGLGGNLDSSSSDPLHQRPDSMQLLGQLGALFSFTPSWALDAGLAYQQSGPSNQALNFLDVQVGIQARFGVGSGKDGPEKNSALRLGGPPEPSLQAKSSAPGSGGADKP